MAVFTYTQVDTVLGKLTNGKKIVHTKITPSNAGTDATTITCRPLRRIDGWFMAFSTPATDTFVCADATDRTEHNHGNSLWGLDQRRVTVYLRRRVS